MLRHQIILSIISSTFSVCFCMAASQPVPADGATAVEVPVTLSFTPGDKIEGAFKHAIFMGTDRKKVAESFYRNQDAVEVYELDDPRVEVSELKPETTYYWRVDLFNDQMEPLRTGKIWSFTTAKADEAMVFEPDLNIQHDVLNEGVGKTGFDGFIGKDQGETADAITIGDGKLTLKSSSGRYEGAARPLGPLVYKTVQGDFKVTARVADYQYIAYNIIGLMAMAANQEDAGKGDDWISVDYFPLYGGIYARMNDENHRQEVCENGQGHNADKWLQLEMQGNMFFLRHSADGVQWIDLPCSPIVRNDLVNIPLRVGVFQATYHKNQGIAAVDNFKLEIREQVKTARVHFPEDGQADVPHVSRLSWIPGVGSQYHDIYMGTSYEDVKAAHNKMPKGSVYQGRHKSTDLQYSFSGLKDGQTYYWRIDEVEGDKIHAGEVWKFTAYDRDLTNFGQYSTSDELAKAWAVKGDGNASLVNANGGKGLKLDVSKATGQNPYAVMAEYTFADDQDWLSSHYGFRYLRVQFKGKAFNRADKLFLIFEDEDWGTRQTVVECPHSAESLKKSSWTQWDIDLQQLVKNNPTFRLTHVRKMAVAVGAPTGRQGSVTIGGITINTRREDDGWPRYIQPEKFVQEVPFNHVEVTGGLWRERMNVNREVSLPHVWGRCESSTKANGQKSHRLDNFRKVAGEMEGGFTGTYFNDSDVYKIIEGTAYSLQMHPDTRLEAYTDKVIDSIAGAQWDDGYLYTFYSLPEHQPKRRWTNVGAMHELYCAGHLFEGAVAYYNATGKRKLLDVAIKFADNICDTFGPDKRTDPPGHQEIEIALMKLYHITGNKKYMDTAKFMIDARGHSVNGRRLYGTYSQDHIPFIEQEKGVGHSVRAAYMFCAAMDVLMENHDEAYANSMLRLWDNITNTKTYLTGGIGQPGGPEGFAGDYELGNHCYAETCSGIAFAMWNHRLHKMTGESKYMDFAERTLLNNMLSSLSQEGSKHYYTNPLTTNGRERWEWPGHDCACCPSSLVRTIASISGYVYTHSDDVINVNMYMPTEGTIPMHDNPVTIKQETDYPWDGNVKLTVDPKKSGSFAVKLRIPGWARNEPLPGNLYKYLDDNTETIGLKVNSKKIDADVEHGYITLDRKWSSGDIIELSLPMTVRRVVCHPNAKANNGLVAIERGPIVYCAEFKDNEGLDVRNLKISDGIRFKATFEKDFYNGVVTLTGSNGVKLIPYYLYSNRGMGWMRVWMPRK